MPRKYSITIGGHRTSYSVEREFQDELTRLARKQGMSVSRLIARIDTNRPADRSLSSAIRLYVLEQLRSRA